MPGQHRKPARAPRLAPLAGSAIAATAAIVLTVTSRPAPNTQPATAAADAALPAGAGKARQDPPPATQPALPVAAAIDNPPAPPRYLKRHAPPLIPCSTDLAGTQPHVAQVGHLIGKTFGIGDIGGAHGRYDGDHGAGLALDFMTADPAQGDAIADFILANKERFGVTYVIWQQRYNDGNGWSYMEDRGSPTQNHYDHVHVSFDSAADVQVTC